MKIHTEHQDGSVDCKQEDRLTGHDREFERLNKAVFYGNGKPALVTQVANLSQTVQALCWLVAVTCGSVIAQIVFMIFKGSCKA